MTMFYLLTFYGRNIIMILIFDSWIYKYNIFGSQLLTCFLYLIIGIFYRLIWITVCIRSSSSSPSCFFVLFILLIFYYFKILVHRTLILFSHLAPYTHFMMGCKRFSPNHSNIFITYKSITTQTLFSNAYSI